MSAEITIIFRSRNLEYASPCDQDMKGPELIEWLAKVLEISYNAAKGIYDTHKRSRVGYSTNKVALTLTERQFTRLMAFRCLHNKRTFFKAPVAIDYKESGKNVTEDGTPIVDLTGE